MHKLTNQLPSYCVAPILCVMASCATTTNTIVPNDFAIQAHVAPGGGAELGFVSSANEAEKLPKPWDLKIDASGHGQSIVFHSVLLRDALDMRQVRQKVSVSAPQLLKLIEAINESQFFSMPRVLCSEPVEHSGGVYFKVTINGGSHEVSMCAGAIRRDEHAAKRLGKIWRVLLSEWRSPNGNKELRWFREKSGSLTD